MLSQKEEIVAIRFLLKGHSFGQKNDLKIYQKFTPIADEECSCFQLFLLCDLIEKIFFKFEKALNDSALADDEVSIEYLALHLLQHFHSSLLVGGVSHPEFVKKDSEEENNGEIHFIYFERSRQNHWERLAETDCIDFLAKVLLCAVTSFPRQFQKVN